MNEIPETIPQLEVYKGARTRWDYFRTLRANEDVAKVMGNASQTASVLTNFIFDTHPDVLDLAPAVSHRYVQSRNVAEAIPDGRDVLESAILNHFEEARERFEKGYALATTATLFSPNHPERPRDESFNGSSAQRVILPDKVRDNALAWNNWIQQMIKDGRIDGLFTSHPDWLAIKLAEGSHLQVGNLILELGDSIGRIRTRNHGIYDAENRLGLPVEERVWGTGFGDWFMMSHIAEKALLDLSEQVKPGMIDGRKLTPDVYVKSYIPALEIIDLNPHLSILGILSDGTWIYSSELARVFPDQHIGQLHGVAGTVVDMGSAEEMGMPEQIYFATLNPERKEAFLKGAYQVTVAARFIDPEGMRKAFEQFRMTA